MPNLKKRAIRYGQTNHSNRKVFAFINNVKELKVEKGQILSFFLGAIPYIAHEAQIPPYPLLYI